MTKIERKNLDILVQEIFRQKPNYICVVSGYEAQSAHHIYGKKDAMRWYLPGMVPIRTKEHNIIHSSDKRSKEYIEKTKENISAELNKELIRRSFTPVKYLSYKVILKYLNGEAVDYI